MDWENVERLEELFQRVRTHLYYLCKGQGTANSEILDLFGLGRSDKAVALCVLPGRFASHLLGSMNAELNFKAHGGGIAFSLPLTGVCNHIFRMLSTETLERIDNEMESEVAKVKSEATHELILSVINQGYSEELMDAARKAGAMGGTVLHARHVGEHEAAKFLGITLQEEKEIVAIVAKKEQKIEIMKAINQSCGITTEARGVVVSLPVDGVMGLSTGIPESKE